MFGSAVAGSHSIRNFGRSVGVAASLGANAQPSVPPVQGRIAQPRLISPAAHAFTSAVTLKPTGSVGAITIGVNALTPACDSYMVRASMPFAWMPPTVLFQVELSDQGPTIRYNLPPAPWLLESTDNVAERMRDPNGTCPGPFPKMLSKRS